MISRRAPKSTRYQFSLQNNRGIYYSPSKDVPSRGKSRSEMQPKQRLGQNNAEILSALSKVAQDMSSFVPIEKPRLPLSHKRRASVMRNPRVSVTRRRRSLATDKLSPYIEHSYDSAFSSRKRGQRNQVEAIQKFFLQFHAKSKNLLAQLQQNVLGDH